MDRQGLSGMEKKARLSWLLAFYGEMLTQNQRELARLNWEEDYSLSEIAEQYSVSRQSVHDTLSRTEKQLEGLEEKLGLLSRFQRMEEGLRACREELLQITPGQDSRGHLDAAVKWIDALLDQEEK